MPRFLLLRAGMRAILTSVVLTILFASGVVAGFWFYPQVFATPAEPHDHDPHDHPADDMQEDAHGDHDHEDEDHVALTEQAFENLGLRLGSPTTGDYWKSVLVPGKVVEIPGRSDLAVSTPVAGVIESVHVIPGQNIPMESPLFTIRLTDEALLAAQARYLETLTQQEVAQQEISRLSPLIQSGGVSGTKSRELEYEVKQLVARQATILQELRGRGMPENQIEQLRRDRILASTSSVVAPKFVQEQSMGDPSSGYSVEKLLVHPGKAVSRGESLCTVAYHQRLYIEGTAFEVDLPTLERIAKKGWKITAETAHDEHDHHGMTSLQLNLLRVDNHVDEVTQTVRFFVELPNEIAQTLTEDGRQFDQWRFRPGQRLHLRLPVERWTDQITLPADAVVVDGPNAFVFAEHDHEEESAEGMLNAASETESNAEVHDEEHDEDHGVFIEFEPVPVRLLHRDDKTVVIANDGQLHDGERVALNNAYKLYLAMKMQAGGGGGHHHHHDH
ncbi:efflux RND transporter periplasmic adaptor subunit [Rubinisphaera sp. JC750]|uniref:efflux RND transporter periplasmic adaptor subunit n=1 Tax=Rubinisphaera sp. JC750 TaxID=2898658 RepID=UPI001F315EF4|nr:efflux RND transporter periplasmic adaptor subunit [Rubinisphaera sp. JC750]